MSGGLALCGAVKMRLERAERGNEDAAGGLLRDAPAVPVAGQRPFLERPLETDDVPQARAAG